MNILYDFITTGAFLINFLCVILMGNLVLHAKGNHTYKYVIKYRPIRSTLFLIALLEFIAVTDVSFIFTPELNWQIFTRVAIINVALTLSALLMLRIAYSIETGIIKIINEGEDDE